MSPRRHLLIVIPATALLAIGTLSGVAGAESSDLLTSPSAGKELRPLDEYWREARACWLRLARIDVSSVCRSDVGQLTTERLLETAHARELVIDLCRLFTNPDDGDLVSHITVRFVDTVPASFDAPDGSFQPPRAGAQEYEVVVLAQYEDAATDPAVFVFGQYPGNPDCAYVFFYQQAASSMAQTLFHELLHVWFLNKFVGEHRRYVTGHGHANRCEFEEEFLELLSANAAELSTIEGHPPLNFGSNRPKSSDAAR